MTKVKTSEQIKDAKERALAIKDARSGFIPLAPDVFSARVRRYAETMKAVSGELLYADHPHHHCSNLFGVNDSPPGGTVNPGATKTSFSPHIGVSIDGEVVNLGGRVVGKSQQMESGSCLGLGGVLGEEMMRIGSRLGGPDLRWPTEANYITSPFTIMPTINQGPRPQVHDDGFPDWMKAHRLPEVPDDHKRRFLDNLVDALSDTSDMTDEELDEELRAQGHDPAEGIAIMLKAIEVQRQNKAIREAFSECNVQACQDHDGEVGWTLTVQPTPLSTPYDLKVVWDGPESDKAAKVYVTSPLLSPKAPYVLSDGSLGLFDPHAGQWKVGDLISETLIPWAVLWCFFYEAWVITGQWLGGGSLHGEHDKTRWIGHHTNTGRCVVTHDGSDDNDSSK